MPLAPAEKNNVVKVNATQIHYDFSGAANAPVLLLSHSLGTDFTMWDAQLPQLSKSFRVLRYDTRGHGQSEISRGPYDFDKLGRDVLGLADELGIGEFSFCGLSMGGVTGMWLGINASYRMHKLVLSSTAAKIGNADAWNARIDAVRKGGLKAVAPGTMERWFTASFRQREPQTVERIQKMVESTNLEGFIACCEALREADFRESIALIRTPTLVISGTHDPGTPPSDGKFIANQIANARYVELDAAHLSNIEQREAFTHELSKFLED
ncbi:MAG: Beta-ketoadipate enol-lactone hydrolase [Candidatus Acidoferrum typicum]|nr:Beta-ketoadipate enol-lactone hydrolase [Candidatus Acidoferrum typicum]